jgi:hypothetical protein
MRAAVTPRPAAPGFGQRGRAEVADGGGFVEQVLLAELHDVALGNVHFAKAVEVAGFLEVIRQRAGENKGGVFQGGFGLGLGVARAAGGGGGERGLLRDGGETGLELGHVGGEVGGVVAGPDGFVGGVVGDVDARANHVDLVREADLHNEYGCLEAVFAPKIEFVGRHVKPFGRKPSFHKGLMNVTGRLEWRRGCLTGWRVHLLKSRGRPLKSRVRLCAVCRGLTLAGGHLSPVNAGLTDVNAGSTVAEAGLAAVNAPSSVVETA